MRDHSSLQIHLITGICPARGPQAHIQCERGDRVGGDIGSPPAHEL